MSTQTGREITIKVLKFNPRSAVSKPHYVEYKLEETPGIVITSYSIHYTKLYD